MRTTLTERSARLDESIELEDLPKLRRPAGRIRRANPRLARAVADFRRAADRIEADRRFTDEHRAERIAELRAELLNKVDALQREAEDDLAHARKRTAPPSSSKDAGERLLREHQLDRAWRRTRELLDAGRDPVEVGQRLVDSGDRLAFEALVAELPSYLELKSSGETTVQIDERRATYLSALRAIETPLLSPAEAEAREALGEAERALGTLSANVQNVAREAESDRASWERNGGAARNSERDRGYELVLEADDGVATFAELEPEA
jgi:hypothetical protein